MSKLSRIKASGILSHKSSELELSPGVNVLIGESNHGKSALLKTVYWAAFNRPNQPKFIARDGAKEQRVELTMTDCSVVTRSKTKSKNRYFLNDHEFTNVGTDVPVEIQNVLGLCEVNFNRQCDPLFFISKTPGERSRFLNDKVADLWLIDVLISEFNSEIRDVRKEEERCKEQAEEVEAEHEKLNWVPDMKKQVKQLDEEKSDLDSELEELEHYRTALQEAKEIRETIPDRKAIKNRLGRVKDLKKAQERAEDWQEELQVLRSDWRKAAMWSQKISKIPRFTKKRREKLSRLTEKATEAKSESKELNKLRSTFDSAKSLTHKLDSLKQEIEELQQQYKDEFPDICPLCGADWSE